MRPPWRKSTNGLEEHGGPARVSAQACRETQAWLVQDSGAELSGRTYTWRAGGTRAGGKGSSVVKARSARAHATNWNLLLAAAAGLPGPRVPDLYTSGAKIRMKLKKTHLGELSPSRRS